MPRVQDGYASAGTGGHARPLRKRPNRLISGENVPARALAWTRVPYSSFPRNDGVGSSSLPVGLGFMRSCGALEARDDRLRPDRGVTVE